MEVKLLSPGKHIYKYICVILLSTAQFWVQAADFSAFNLQTISVTGKVNSSDGFSLPGVTVLEKGTNNATATDADGNFAINVAGTESVLVFSFIGFENQEITVAGQSTINVTLTENITALNEIVVVGYGTTTKKEVTGSIASVSSDEFLQGVMTSPIGAIQGKVAGLSIVNSNGSDPNSDYTIRIRGLNSFSGGNSPLIIVDGAVWGGSLNMIDPEQVKTIDILKDGAAAAIYGTRATNGVILITLKEPMVGKPSFEFSSFVSFEAVNKAKNWMTASEYRKAITEFAPTQPQLDKGSSTNWLEEVTQRPVNQNYNLAFSGGRDNVAYRANLNYKDNQGLFKDNYSKVVSPSIMISQKAFENKLSIDYKLLYSRTESSDVPSDLLYQTLVRNPTEPVYDPTNTTGGGYYNNQIQGSKNPVAMLNESTYDRELHFLNGTINAGYKLLDNLTLNLGVYYNTWLGFDGSYLTQYYPLLGKTGEASVGAWKTSSIIIEPNVTYSFSINDDHQFQVMGGYSFYEGTNSNMDMMNRNFDTDNFSYNNIEAGNDLAVGLAQMSTYKESNRLIAFFGRATYNYRDKYLASVSLRQEGSSRFGRNNRWGSFPALSVGWRLNEEGFLDNATWIDNLKIRAGVGVTGNQDIPNYQSIPRLSTRIGDSGSLFYYQGEWVTVYVPDNNPNPDLKWEKKTEYNIGVDYGFFKRLTGSIDLYQRDITDLLWWYNVPVPPNVYNNIYANVGAMTNKGIEIQIRGNIISTPNASWTSTFTYSKNVNTVKKLADPDKGYQLDYIKITPAATNWAQLLREGDPVGNFLAPVYLGSDEDGNPIYEDLDDDGSVDVNSIGDRKVVGNEYPDFEMGWQNEFTYKKFFLTCSFRARVGQSLLNWDRMNFENTRPLRNGYNAMNSLFDHPDYEGQIAYDSRFVDKASFVKLDNLVFGYNFDLGKNKLQLYVSGSNLLTMTKFKGNDPEQTVPGFNTDTEKSGGDNLTYPYSRTFLTGLKFNF